MSECPIPLIAPNHARERNTALPSGNNYSELLAIFFPEIIISLQEPFFFNLSLSQWQEKIKVVIFLDASFVCFLRANALYIIIVLNNTIGIRLENKHLQK